MKPRVGLLALVLVAAVALLTAPLVAEAQRKAKTPRIGILDLAAHSPTWPRGVWVQFVQRLRDLGYVWRTRPS